MRETSRMTLLNAGLRAFMAHGFEGAGITEILAGTELSRGAFYHHFESKMDLYRAVIDQFFPSPIDAIDWANHRALSAGEQKAAIAELYRQIEVMSLGADVDPVRHFTLFFDSLSRLADYRARTDKAYADLIGSLAAALTREGQDKRQAGRDARAYIARFEGELYLWAVSGTAPDFSKDDQQ